MSFSHKQVFVKSSDKLKGRSVMLLISSSLSVLMVCLCGNVCLWSILPNWVFLREKVNSETVYDSGTISLSQIFHHTVSVGNHSTPAMLWIARRVALSANDMTTLGTCLRGS